MRRGGSGEINPHRNFMPQENALRIKLTVMKKTFETQSHIEHLMNWPHAPLISLALLALLSACAARDKTIYRPIEEKKYQVIDIKLSPWPFSHRSQTGYEPNFYGFWLNNKDLVMSVLQDVPNAFARKLERIVLIDTSTGAYKVLIEQGYVNCRSREHKVMAYLPYGLDYYSENKDKNIPDDYKFIHLDDDGKLTPLAGPSPIERNCAPAGSPVGDPPRGKRLKEFGSYIDLSAKDDDQKKTLGMATLALPNRPPIELGFSNAAVSKPIYLPYYDKYLMSASDYGTFSGTSQKNSGIFWKFPYKNSPYWMVNRDGAVDYAPYPEILSEYGIQSFNYLWPTPHGTLISHNGGIFAGKGLLLLKGDQLQRIWGGPLSLNPFQDNRGRGEKSYVLNISPDACRIVFTHSKNYPTPAVKNPGPIELSVLNICTER